ncbi:MAG: C25 family cysteine peptidase [Candidatus Eiseniibacteriota bacterium]
MTRTLEVDPEPGPATVQMEIPHDQVVARVQVIALECAVDGARAPLGVTAHVSYQGFQDGRHLAWLELPEGRGLPPEHGTHKARVTVRLGLEPSAARPVVRERAVWWERGGTPGDAAARPQPAGHATDRSAPRASSSPRGRQAEPFLPTQVPSLLGSPVAYLIVTIDSLVPAFEPLANWKTASGVPAVIRTLSFIRETYPAAADDPERIRLFIRDAYARWGTRWVLLGGDTEILAPRYAHVMFPADWLIPSDLYFSCLDGTWNADGDSTFADAYVSPSNQGDGADLLPEVWVGRAPVVTPADAELFVRKTLTYQTTPVADYMENVLFFAEVILPQNWSPGQPVQFDGASLVEFDELPILDTAPNIHVARMYQNYTDPRWRPGAVPETRAAVLDSLNQGYNLAVHIGHGYREVMSVGDDNLSNIDMHALGNGDRLTNVLAIDCTSNAIDFASIGEALMRAPAGGAVTSVGSTTLDYPTATRGYQKEYFRLLFQDGVTAVGEAQGRQKTPFVGNAFTDGIHRLTQLSFLLLGDPELHIFTARPRELTVTAPGSITAGDGAFTVSASVTGVPLSGARVTAWMPGHEYRTGLTDGSGNLTLEFHPDAVGPCSLTVTAFNARPWRGSLQVVPGAPAALQAVAPVVLDDQLAGRDGDEDGVAEAGEHVDLVLALHNGGGTGATAVTGTLGTTDPWITITGPTADYGGIAPDATVSPPTGFAVTIAHDCPDQREVAFTLDLSGDGGLLQSQPFRLLVRSPELAHVGHAESEEGGNGDGRPQPGETVSYSFRLRNVGTADAHALDGRLRSLDGLATVLDSTFVISDLPAGGEASTTPLRFVPTSASAKLWLVIDDATGPRLSQVLDLDYPNAVASLAATGGAGRVTLTWQHGPAPDLAGYYVHRATDAAGPFVKVAPLPLGRTSSWTDAELLPLTRYYYRVTAIDSSGNESGPAGPASAVTGPREHAGFPRFTRESSQTPVAIAPAPPGSGRDILVGGSVLHMFHPDGTAPVDADGSSATPGDFTTLGDHYQGGGSIADLDADGGRDVVGAAWNSMQLLAFDAQGAPRPGFPVSVGSPIWSSVAVGDLDADGHSEMVFASLGGKLYVFRHTGAEWLDGDANPGTIGVFKVLGGSYNPGTPALADLDDDGRLEIVYASIDGFLYAWKRDGTNMPGFPVGLSTGVFGSVAIGRLDGPGGPLSIVVPVGDNSIAVRLANGSNRPGFPKLVPITASGRSPSPALADMNGDGLLDIVIASTNGRVYVYDRNGALLAPWTAASRYSSLTSEATMASPVVADIDGDGRDDVVVGDETGSLAGLSGATGGMLPGFPIALAAEAWGTPALCDCDADGLSEIVVVDFGGTVHMWDYDFPFSPAGPAPWPQFQHDARRTGTNEPSNMVGIGPDVAAAPRVAELAAPRPNPAREAVELGFGVPIEQNGAALELAIYDLAGRRVRTLAQGQARAGRGRASWDMRDGRGERAPAGVFLVRMTLGGRTLTRKVVVLP